MCSVCQSRQFACLPLAAVSACYTNALCQVGQHPSSHQLVECQRRLLQQLLKLREPQLEGFSDIPEHNMGRILEALSSRCRFCIILDDVWDAGDVQDKLLPLKQLLRSCSAEGSWLVVTSRNRAAVTQLLGERAAQKLPVSKVHNGSVQNIL